MRNLLQSPFVIGLAIGLGIALWVQILKWIKCWKLKRRIRDLTRQLGTLSSSAAAIATHTADEIAKLKAQVANQKVTIELLREKPEKKELRELRLYASAYEMMVSQAPGFAQAWQNCVEKIKEEEEKESWGTVLFRRPIQRIRQCFTMRKLPADVVSHTGVLEEGKERILPDDSGSSHVK